MPALPRFAAALCLAALAAAPPAPLRAQGRPPLPVATAGDVRLRLDRVTWTRDAALEFGAPAAPLPGRRSAAASVDLQFTLGARSPEALDAVVLGPLRPGSGTAEDDRGRRAASFAGRLFRDEDATQLTLTLSGLHPEAREITTLRGELPSYPRARRIRFHVPWLKDEVPLTVEVDGGAATLKRFRLVGADSTLWVSLRPPAGFALAPFGAPGALTGRAMDIDGNLVNAGGVAEVEQTVAGPEPEFRFHCPGLRRTPSRLMLDVLCVAGEPRGLPFRLTGLRLPPP